MNDIAWLLLVLGIVQWIAVIIWDFCAPRMTGLLFWLRLCSPMVFICCCLASFLLLRIVKE